MEFLATQLRLKLRDATATPSPARKGVDFVGWKTFWNYRVPRRRTLASCAARLRRFERTELPSVWNGTAVRIEMAHPSARAAKVKGIEDLRSSLASYSGYLRHGSAWGAWQRLCRQHPWLEDVFVHDGWELTSRWTARPVSARRFAQQYARLIKLADDRALVFCQVGRFVEFYGPQRELATRVLGLLRVRIARGGHAFAVGFPAKLRTVYTGRALRAGYVVADVRELVPTNVRPNGRRVVALWLPMRAGSPRDSAAREPVFGE